MLIGLSFLDFEWILNVVILPFSQYCLKSNLEIFLYVPGIFPGVNSSAPNMYSS